MTDHQQPTKVRSQFEAFFADSRRGQGRIAAENQFNLLGDGSYAKESTQRHWWTWQNAVRCARAAAPSGAPQAEAALSEDQIILMAKYHGIEVQRLSQLLEFAAAIARATTPGSMYLTDPNKSTILTSFVRKTNGRHPEPAALSRPGQGPRVP